MSKPIADQGPRPNDGVRPFFNRVPRPVDRDQDNNDRDNNPPPPAPFAQALQR